MTRPSGLRGLLPLDPAKHARFKTAADYGFTFPTPTYPIDRSGGIRDFGMAGNGPDPTLTVNGGNPGGDCGVAAVPAHAGMTTAVLAGEDLVAATMTSNAVMALYFTYEAEKAGIDWRPTGESWVAPEGLDNGVDLGDWLLWLFQHDLIEGFVKLELGHMDAALALFDVVVAGVSLNPDADRQFSEGEPWNIGPGDEPDPEMGHAILYLSAAAPGGPFGWATWGADQSSTLAWRQSCPQQAFAVLTKQLAQAKGFPFAALEADLKALGGTVVDPAPDPAPNPAPGPVPDPQPAVPPPDPGHAGLLASIRAVFDRAIGEVEHLLGL